MLNTVKKKYPAVYMSARNIGASGRRVPRFSLCAADPTQCPGLFFKSPTVPFLLLLAVMLLGATLKGRVPRNAVQLSEAVVGGRVPWRLAQQTVCGVL